MVCALLITIIKNIIPQIVVHTINGPRRDPTQGEYQVNTVKTHTKRSFWLSSEYLTGSDGAPSSSVTRLWNKILTLCSCSYRMVFHIWIPHSPQFL